MDFLGQFAIVHLLLHVVCICLAYWAINAMRLDVLFKKGHVAQLQVCMILIAILLGTATSNFIADLLQYSTQVKFLFN